MSWRWWLVAGFLACAGLATSSLDRGKTLSVINVHNLADTPLQKLIIDDGQRIRVIDDAKEGEWFRHSLRLSRPRNYMLLVDLLGMRSEPIHVVLQPGESHNLYITNEGVKLYR